MEITALVLADLARVAVFAASGADVVQVVRDGVVVSTPEDRRAAGAELDRVVRSIWED